MDVIWIDCDGNQMPGASPTELSSMQNKLDGGSLLHKMPWPRWSTYNSECDMYVNNVCRNYVKPTIVFDFIYLLGNKLKEASCALLHAESDAAVLIVQTRLPPGEMIMNCSWTFMNSSWMFVNKKLWTFMNVHQRVHERFMNILEQQMRLSWKFMSAWTYYIHELALCSWTCVVHERSWTQIIHEPRLIHERPWTRQIHEPDS